MNINKNNYEEYFLLYTDNELSAAERQEVEAFVLINPELEGELALLSQTKLVADETETFNKKQDLLHFENGAPFIHAGNCEARFIQYADDELGIMNKAAVEQFLYENPFYENDFRLILSLRLAPDLNVHFPDKQLLFRHEEKSRPVIYSWWKMAAAAVVLIVAGTIWMNNSSSLQPFIRLAKKELKAVPADQIAANSSLILHQKPVLKLPEPTPADRPVPAEEIKKTAGNETNSVLIHPATNVREVKLTSTHIALLKPALRQKINTLQADVSDGSITASPSDPVTPMPTKGSIATNGNGQPEHNRDVSAQASANGPEKTVPRYLVNNSPASEPASENVYLANIPVERKNSLRGILRKATRFIEKTTNVNPEKRSGIAIGNIEIAFQ